MPDDVLSAICDETVRSMISVTHDSIALRGAGVVAIDQPAQGHRFTLDSILLADFCRFRADDRILEPGAGTGLISIALAKKFPGTTFFAFEIQEPLARLCRRNVHANGLDERIIMICRDIRRLPASVAPRTFEAIIANPPYTRSGTGRPSPASGRRIARHDAAAPLDAWLDLHVLLKNRGTFTLVFPVARLTELIGLMRDRNLEPKRLRLVHPYLTRPASVVLIEAVKAGRTGMEVLPPLIVHGPDGNYSEEMREIYAGE